MHPLLCCLLRADSLMGQQSKFCVGRRKYEEKIGCNEISQRIVCFGQVLFTTAHYRITLDNKTNELLESNIIKVKTATMT